VPTINDELAPPIKESELESRAATQSDETIRRQRLPALMQQPQSPLAPAEPPAPPAPPVSLRSEIAPQQPPRESKRHSYPRIFFLGILALLVALSGTGLFYLLTPPPVQFSGLPQNPDPEATSLA